jgi:predicted enzyme involved in methoxymalonyl-ACP biosynthesis
MNTQTQNPKPQVNVFSFLTEKEKDRVVRLIISSDRKYEELKKELEKMLAYFQELEIKLYYLSEEDPKYKEAYTKISEAVQKMEEMIYSIPSPPEIINKAFGEKE